MKLLHAVHNFPPEFVGGTEAYLEALVGEQIRRGHEVIVVAGSEVPGTDELVEEIGGVRVVRLRHDADRERFAVDFRIPRLEARFRDLLERERPDRVHVHHYLNLGVPMLRVARELGIPTVLSLHDFTVICPRFFLVRGDGGFCGDDLPVPRARCLDCCHPEFVGSRSALEVEFERRRAFFDGEVEAAGAVLVPSRRAMMLLQDAGILRRLPRIEVLPLGLLKQLNPEPPGSRDESRLRVVFFGNVAPVKGVDLLLEAVADLPEEKRSRIEVLLLGRDTDRELKERIAQLAPKLQLEREAKYDSARLERLPLEADLAAFPGSAPETYSLVVDEALALGLPVIVSDRGAGAERAGGGALVVETGSKESLQAALVRLLDEPGLLDRMRKAVGRRVFTIADNAERLDAIYASLPGSDPIRDEDASAPAIPRFDPEFRFLPLRDFATVPGGRVCVLAPHPDDEIIGAGGALALHAARGDQVTVVHVTDGAGGDREGKAEGEIRRVRKEESRAAGGEIGITEFRALDFPDGRLRPSGAYLAGLWGVVESIRPDVIYVPSPFEHHPDHRATFQLALRALEGCELRPTVLLYEVNEPQSASYLLDITSVLDDKRRALSRFVSQRAYLDVAEKTLTANRARTVNVDVEAVEAAEAYLEIQPERLRELALRVESLTDFVDAAAAECERVRNGAELAMEDASVRPRETVPVSAVISTWNKCDDVRENLLALRRQTRPPAEVIVVDNASNDGTQEMIRREFPEVNLIAMPSSEKGACETFNIGFKAATQAFTAIMDDDVVAPPEWLETLVDGMQSEDASTAMISSKVIEPGMPERFIHSEEVNRPRYMATFRGCGTLARTDVLRDAGYYDEAFFIYGNERDLSARVLGLGHRILQYPKAEIFHKTPFGMKAGKRSLYFHVRNFWLYAFKNCTWGQVIRSGWKLGMKGIGIGGKKGYESDATGTIGIDKSIKATSGGMWIAIKATLAAIVMLPYCLKHRRVCRHPDFKLPV